MGVAYLALDVIVKIRSSKTSSYPVSSMYCQIRIACKKEEMYAAAGVFRSRYFKSPFKVEFWQFRVCNLCVVNWHTSSRCKRVLPVVPRFSRQVPKETPTTTDTTTDVTAINRKHNYVIKNIIGLY